MRHYRTVELEFEIDEFKTDELITEIGYRVEGGDLSKQQIDKLKEIIKHDEEAMLESYILEHEQHRFVEKASLSNVMKLDVIFKNLDKFTYLDICEIFEGPQPYQS